MSLLGDVLWKPTSSPAGEVLLVFQRLTLLGRVSAPPPPPILNEVPWLTVQFREGVAAALSHEVSVFLGLLVTGY